MFIKNLLKNSHVFAPILAYLILLVPTLYIYSGSPPETEVQVYKGAWFPTVLPSAMAEMKDMGMNTVFFMGDPGAIIIATVQTAHRNGLKVALTIGRPQGDFDLEVLNSNIIELAKLAEKYGVEFFAPMNEPDSIFEEDTERWAQDILPRIREVYHGEVIWKGADVRDDDLSGYDYLGFSICPVGEMTPEDYSQHFDDVLDQALAVAERYNLKGVMVTEFGTWAWESWLGEPERSEDDIARTHEVVLERGKDKAVGFFYLDRFPGVSNKAEEVISRWYKEIL